MDRETKKKHYKNDLTQFCIKTFTDRLKSNYIILLYVIDV